jgi:hypothetical protein
MFISLNMWRSDNKVKEFYLLGYSAVVRWKSVDVSEEHVTSIFKIDDKNIIYFLQNFPSLPRNSPWSSMKNAIFWDVAPCRSCVNRRFGGTHRLQLQGRKTRERGTRVRCLQPRWFLARGFFYPEDGGDTFLRNVGSHKIYTASHPRRRHSS